MGFGTGTTSRTAATGDEDESRTAATREREEERGRANDTGAQRGEEREREERSMFLWRFVNRLLRAPPIAGDTPGLNTCFPPFLPTHRLHGLSLCRPSTLPTTPFPHPRTLSPRAIYSRTLLASTETLAETVAEM